MQQETQGKYSGKTLEQRFDINKCATIIMTGFNLKTCDSYLTILFKVFMNHILAENTYFVNPIMSTKHKIMVLKPEDKYQTIWQSYNF